MLVSAPNRTTAVFPPMMDSPSLQHPIVRLTLHAPTAHTTPHVSLEPLAIRFQILGSLLIQRIARVRLEKQELQAHDDRVQIQNGFPVFSQDVQTHVTLEVDVRVVDLLGAFHFGRVVREILVDDKGEVEGAAAVHALVGLDGEGEVEDVVGVGEGGAHGAAEGELGEI